MMWRNLETVRPMLVVNAELMLGRLESCRRNSKPGHVGPADFGLDVRVSGPDRAEISQCIAVSMGPRAVAQVRNSRRGARQQR
jgi:hypothetical protein